MFICYMSRMSCHCYMPWIPCHFLHVYLLHECHYCNMSICYMSWMPCHHVYYMFYYMSWISCHRLHSYQLYTMDICHESHKSIKKYFLRQWCMGYSWRNHDGCSSISIDNAWDTSTYGVIILIIRAPLRQCSWHNHCGCQNIFIKTILGTPGVIVLIIRVFSLKYSWHNHSQFEYLWRNMLDRINLIIHLFLTKQLAKSFLLSNSIHVKYFQFMFSSFQATLCSCHVHFSSCQVQFMSSYVTFNLVQFNQGIYVHV